MIADRLMIVISDIIYVVYIVIFNVNNHYHSTILFAYSCRKRFSLHIPGIHLLKVWVNHAVNFITNLQRKQSKHSFEPYLVYTNPNTADKLVFLDTHPHKRNKVSFI